MVLCSSLTRPEHLGPVHGLIFDCDGVLFDSLESNRIYYNAILDKLGLGPMDEEQERFVHMHTAAQSLRHIVPQERWAEIDGAVARVDYGEEILPHLKPEPGLYALLDWLRGTGVRMAVSTNRSTTMGMVSRRFGLEHYFWPILDARKVRAKPHPEGVNAILGKWGMDRSRTAYIGDSSVDENTARAGGVRFWAYKNPHLTAHLHVPDFPTLHGCLKRIRGQGDVCLCRR